MDCVCRTVDLADVLSSLSHVVHGFSALTCEGTIARRTCTALNEEMLEGIDQQLLNTLCHARMLRNGFSRINQLPPEVLGNIFGMIYDEQVPPSRHQKRSTSWLVVLGVCRYWRMLALSTPRLWTFIDVHGLHDDEPDGFPRRSLLFSREAPLTVHLHQPSKYRESFIYRAVLSQMWRVREMHVYGVYSPEDLLDFTSLPAPFLDTFVVHAGPEGDRSSHWQLGAHGHHHHLPPFELPALFAQDAPRLSYLAVEKFRVSPQNTFTRLRHLWLQPTKFALPRDLGMLLGLLDANPALEDLIIESAILATPLPASNINPLNLEAVAPRRISLPKLHRFVFNTCEAGFVALLLSHLALPPHTAMRLVACTAHGHWPAASMQSRVLLPADVSTLENVMSVDTLALQLGGDVDRHICAVARDSLSSAIPNVCPMSAGAKAAGSGGALWISDRTHADGWIVDRLCPSLPMQRIDELWLTGFDNRPPQRWHRTFLSMPALSKLVLTDANWNAEDWLHALSMQTPSNLESDSPSPTGADVDVDMEVDTAGISDASSPCAVSVTPMIPRACPGLKELHVRAPSATLWGPLNTFLQDRANCGLPIERLHIMLLPTQRPEVVQLFAAHAEEWRAFVRGEVRVEVVERFPRMPLPAVCARESKTNGFWPSWHEGSGY